MTRDVIIHDIRGRRTCTDADFPLRIGRGSQADIRLEDDGTNTEFAIIGRSDAHVFVQPIAGAPPLIHNGEVLTGSRWLEHGDTLGVSGTVLRYTAGATGITFSVDVEVVAPVVTPPAAPPPASTGLAGDVPVAAVRPGSKRGRAIRWMALSVFLVLVLITGFVFLSTPVSVHVTPVPDRVRIDGIWPTVEVGGRLLMIPGEYRVRAAKAGYRALDTQVEIVGSEHRSLEFVLEKLPGIVNFTIRPDVGATVSMDDEVIGSAPLGDVEVPPGEHTFDVVAERYAPASLRVDVRGLGERQSVEVALTPLWAEVSITSRPAGARVLLDDRDIGATPLRADILQGTYRLTLALDGFDALTTPLEVIADQAQQLPEFTLVESDGVLTVETSPAGASVSVAGRYRGRTPLELSLAPRLRHTLKITKAGYESIQRNVEVMPAASERLALTMSPRYGSVFITALPADADLYVDGKLHGPATGRIKLTAKPHRLEFKKPGYETFSTTVTPRAGVGQALSVTLVETPAAKAAAREPVIRTAAGQRLILLMPGRFRMGASRREQGRRANESLRLVEITRPYYLSSTEVSNADYRRFKPDHSSGSVRRRSLNEPEQPVVQVSWEDAVRYLNWLSAQDDLPPAYERSGETFTPVQPPTIGYRLPTEAEWAFAARYAGSSDARKYSWGESYPPTGSAGNYADESAAALLPNTLNGYGDGYDVSAPVGRFAAIGPGFLDLGGNVSEWCQDYYAVYPGAAETLVTDPTGPAVGRHHVVRGSSWRHGSISELRLSYRDYSEETRNDLGFRIARYAE